MMCCDGFRHIVQRSVPMNAKSITFSIPVLCEFEQCCARIVQNNQKLSVDIGKDNGLFNKFILIFYTGCNILEVQEINLRGIHRFQDWVLYSSIFKIFQRHWQLVGASIRRICYIERIQFVIA